MNVNRPQPRDAEMKAVDVIIKLKENQKQHIKIVEEAREGYRIKFRRELSDKIAKLDSGNTPDLNFYDMPMVIDYRYEYDSAIKMMELSTQDTITLNTDEVNSYLMDRWWWQDEFYTANVHYSELAKDRARTLPISSPSDENW